MRVGFLGSRPALWSMARARAATSLRSWVRRSDDRRLVHLAGSRAGLRVLFTLMQSSFVAAAADGFTGELAYELRGGDGIVTTWALAVTPDGARARPGPALAPSLTVKLGVADFVRIAAGELDPGAALLAGRLDLVGDFALAIQLGAMFGRPGL